MKTIMKYILSIILMILAVIISLRVIFISNVKKLSFNNDTINNINFNNVIDLDNKVLKDKKYMKFENMKYENIFKEYDIDEIELDNSRMRKLSYSEDGSTVKGMNIYIGNTIFSTSKEEYETNLKNIFMLKNLDVESILKKYNINNDIDLIKYVYDNKDKKFKYTDNIQEDKEMILLYKLLISIYPEVDEIIYLNGTYNGLMISTSSYVKVIFIKDNINYSFIFYGYSEEEIINFISSVVIE